jgi:hypothetical protein
MHHALTESIASVANNQSMSPYQFVHDPSHTMSCVRLVPMVGWLYLNLNHTISVFSLPLDHQCSSNSLQHSNHSYISISHVNLFSLSQHHHSRLNHFRIYFVDNKLKKTN